MASASTTTVNGTQAIKTLNNLNMEGKFKESSLKQFSNENTAVITYTSELRNAAANSNVKLYDAISETLVTFTLRQSSPFISNNEFTYDTTGNNAEQIADNTAQNLVDRINDITLQGTATNNHYSAIIEYFSTLNDASDDGSCSITLYNYQTEVVFTMVTGNPSPIHKAEITYTDLFNTDTSNENKTITLFQGGTNNNNTGNGVVFTMVTGNPSPIYKAEITYTDLFNTGTNNVSKTITLFQGGTNNNNTGNEVVFTMVTGSASALQFQKGNDVDTTATNLSTAINNHNAFSSNIDTANNKIIVSQVLSSGGIGATVTTFQGITINDFTLNPNDLQFKKETDVDTTATNLSTAINNHNAFSSNIDTANNKIIVSQVLSSGGIGTTVTTFQGITINDFTLNLNDIQFKKETDVDATATNLSTAINNHSAFSAILDSTTNEGRIIITQISSSGKPTNNAQTGFLPTELSVTNFSNFSATIDKSSSNGGTITVTQITSKSYEPNGKTTFTDAELSLTDFNVNSGDEAAIPSETIGTYQILNKVITDLSTLKKKIITRNKTLQGDVSEDHDSDVTLTLTSDSSTHQSNLSADQNRGYLDGTTNSSSPNHQKPSVFESDTINYSEDALFTLLKGLGYEIFKFNNGYNGANNGSTPGDAGQVAIPISIQAHNNTTSTATLSNVTATIHNINRSDGTIDTSASTSAGSIPEGTDNSVAGVGLIQLINSIINNITLIKRSIKTRELAILTALKSNITNLETDSIINMDIANRDSTIQILKVRGGLLDDDNSNNDLHKPSIFSSGNNLHYSEDAVFSLFSCISYELMRLLKGHSGNNNGGGVLGAGLQTIPASIESI